MRWYYPIPTDISLYFSVCCLHCKVTTVSLTTKHHPHHHQNLPSTTKQTQPNKYSWSKKIDTTPTNNIMQPENSVPADSICILLVCFLLEEGRKRTVTTPCLLDYSIRWEVSTRPRPIVMKSMALPNSLPFTQHPTFSNIINNTI